jgi:hypothetical protein
VFVELPCTEPDPVVRLALVARAMAVRKRGGEFEEVDAVVRALGYVPRPVRTALAHAFASPRMYNLVVSNIPGPRLAAYLRGCRLREIYPVVPLAERHALSIGMTTVEDRACFGLYADEETLPDADALAGDVRAAVAELAAPARRAGARRRSPSFTA